MSNENKALECVADQFGLKRLYPKNRLFTGTGSSVSNQSNGKRQVEVPSIKMAEFLKPEMQTPKAGICMFAEALISNGSENRICTTGDGHFCPKEVFADPKIFLGCTLRNAKLDEQT